MDKQITIERITKNEDIFLTQINSLLDEGVEWDIEQGRKFLENSDNAVFVAVWEQKAVGFLTAYRLQRFDKRQAEVLLYEIGVSENFRQKGIGKALIEKVRNWGKEIDADEIWVLTNKSNTAANALYQSAGGRVENIDDTMYVFKL